MIKPYVSAHPSPGGNENTDKLKALFSRIVKMRPVVTYCPEKDPYPDDKRIKAILFSGLPFNGHETRAFAYMGFPENASADSPVPGMVLVHGGGGHAYAEWVRYWIDNGYAAISFDGFGQRYVGPDNTYDASLDFWKYDPSAQPPMEDYAIKDKAFEEHGFTFFVADVVLANTVLRRDKRVMSGSVGYTGISWGGIGGGLAVCLDSRFSFAAPVYGSGFQFVSKTEWGEVFRGEGVSDVWDAGLLLGEPDMPMHWFNSDSDPFFDANASTACAAAAKNGSLTLIHGFTHGQIEGSALPEILRFADEMNGKGQRNIKVMSVRRTENGGEISFSLPDDVQNVKAFLYYKTEDLIYSGKYLRESWKSVFGELTGDTAFFPVPANAHIFYFALEGQTKGGQTLHASTGTYTREIWDKN
ncbi:MAG: hypothetical protein IJS90_05440 [Clostridia bacterium]|nr:hypothetical protein [Clostridia bacterium]